MSFKCLTKRIIAVLILGGFAIYNRVGRRPFGSVGADSVEAVLISYSGNNRDGEYIDIIDYRNYE